MRFWSAIDLLHCNGILPLVLEWWFLPLEEGKIIFHSMVSAKSPKKNPGQKCLLAWPPPLHLRSNQREKGEHWSSLFLSPSGLFSFLPSSLIWSFLFINHEIFVIVTSILYLEEAQNTRKQMEVICHFPTKRSLTTKMRLELMAGNLEWKLLRVCLFIDVIVAYNKYQTRWV